MLGMVHLARERKVPVIVIAAPYRDRVTNTTEAQLMLHYRAALRAAMEKEQVPFLEIRELTEEAYPANEGWFGELIHPNHMGHRLIASELLRLIASNRVLADLNIPALTP